MRDEMMMMMMDSLHIVGVGQVCPTKKGAGRQAGGMGRHVQPVFLLPRPQGHKAKVMSR